MKENPQFKSLLVKNDKLKLHILLSPLIVIQYLNKHVSIYKFFHHLTKIRQVLKSKEKMYRLLTERHTIKIEIRILQSHKFFHFISLYFTPSVFMELAIAHINNH